MCVCVCVCVCVFVFRFKLDQQAKFIERVQNVEVREAKVKGRSEPLILSYHTAAGHYYCCLSFLMPGQLFSGRLVSGRIKTHARDDVHWFSLVEVFEIKGDPMCVCVCVHVCVHACVHACMHVCVCAGVCFVCACVCVFVYSAYDLTFKVCVCVCVCVHFFV